MSRQTLLGLLSAANSRNRSGASSEIRWRRKRPARAPKIGDPWRGLPEQFLARGGLTPARRMIARARQLGLKVMIGCMSETTVGISALAQLTPLVDYADTDGSLLIARDVASGVAFERGRVKYPDVNGCGVTFYGKVKSP